MPNFHRFGVIKSEILDAKRACLEPKLGNVMGGENCLGPPWWGSHVDQIQGRPEQGFRPPWPTGRTEHCRTLKHSPSLSMLHIVGAQVGKDPFGPLSKDRGVGDRNLPFHFGCLTKASSLSMSIPWVTDWVELRK